MTYANLTTSINGFISSNNKVEIVKLITYENVIEVQTQGGGVPSFPTFQNINNLEDLSSGYFALLDLVQIEIDSSNLSGILDLFIIDNILIASIGQELEEMIDVFISHEETEGISYQTQEDARATARTETLSFTVEKQTQIILPTS